jgi:glycosyltransferase involved in cell wall biosynthesis
MKILMLTPYLPYPPSSGGQIRSYNLIKQLSKKHEITLYSLIKYEEEKQYVKELEKYCKKVKIYKRAEKPWTINNIINTALSFYPFLVIRNYSKQEKQNISEILKKEQFDIIHAETFYVYPHIPDTKIPVILVDQTIEYQVYQHYVQNFKYWWLKPLLWIDVLKIKYWETYFWKKASRAVAVSESDAKKMESLVSGLKVSVVPNGVDEELSADTKIHYSKNILFIGNYDWMQNREAAQILVNQVFPIIKNKIKDVKCIIAGQYTEKISGLQSSDVQFFDLKSENIARKVKQAYQQSGVMVAPLYGPGGTRLKIFSAMANRLPVVTTNIGAEGLDAINGESILYGQSPEDLANLTIKLLNNRDLYEKIANNARELVEKKYSYDAISSQLDEIYQEVINNGG